MPHRPLSSRLLRAAALLGAAALVALPSAGFAASALGLTVKQIGPVEPVAQASAIAPAVAPAAPSSLTGQSVSPFAAVLLWRDNSSNETGFIIEARPADSATFTVLPGAIAANATSATVDGLSPGTTYVFRVRSTNTSGESGASNTVTVTSLSSTACLPSATAMCLNDNEFRVQALYLTNAGQSGEAKTEKLTADSGYLWFFAASNIEAVVKVLDGCASNSHFWVFAGGLTDVRVVLTVTDTVADISRSYNNPLGTAFQPIQDTSAFATCPN